jgi:hypothetical protein
VRASVVAAIQQIARTARAESLGRSLNRSKCREIQIDPAAERTWEQDQYRARIGRELAVRSSVGLGKGSGTPFINIKFCIRPFALALE